MSSDPNDLRHNGEKTDEDLWNEFLYPIGRQITYEELERECGETFIAGKTIELLATIEQEVRFLKNNRFTVRESLECLAFSFILGASILSFFAVFWLGFVKLF